MATEIRVPTLGESVSEATIGSWLKQKGDAIAVDEPLVELETDKVSIEVPAPSAGVLVDILVTEGDTVEVGALLGMIAEGEGAAAKPVVAASAATPSPAPAAVDVAQGNEMPAAPSAQKMMTEKAIDPSSVEGSGKRGQLLKEDVMKAGSAPAPTASAMPRVSSPADDEAREERVKMTRLRQTIARRLKDAQNTAAMLTTYNEVDMSAVMDLRKKYKELFEKKHGVKLGFMGFFNQSGLSRFT